MTPYPRLALALALAFNSAGFAAADCTQLGAMKWKDWAVHWDTVQLPGGGIYYACHDDLAAAKKADEVPLYEIAYKEVKAPSAGQLPEHQASVVRARYVGVIDSAGCPAGESVCVGRIKGKKGALKVKSSTASMSDRYSFHHDAASGDHFFSDDKITPDLSKAAPPAPVVKANSAPATTPDSNGAGGSSAAPPSAIARALAGVFPGLSHNPAEEKAVESRVAQMPQKDRDAFVAQATKAAADLNKSNDYNKWSGEADRLRGAVCPQAAAGSAAPAAAQKAIEQAKVAAPGGAAASDQIDGGSGKAAPTASAVAAAPPSTSGGDPALNAFCRSSANDLLAKGLPGAPANSAVAAVPLPPSGQQQQTAQNGASAGSSHGGIGGALRGAAVGAGLAALGAFAALSLGLGPLAVVGIAVVAGVAGYYLATRLFGSGGAAQPSAPAPQAPPAPAAPAPPESHPLDPGAGPVK